MKPPLEQVYDKLLASFGPQRWWPGDSPFEVIVGAVLVQNTAWRNVERAINNLKEEGVLTPRGLRDIPKEELEELIRPAGYFRLKASRLRNLINHLWERYDGMLERMFAIDVEELRAELLSVNGIGPETADSIILYAGNLPSFVVDTYTNRVLKRHGWIEPEAGYHAIKEFFEQELERDAELYNEYHALLVRVGHLHCRRVPKCDDCPLQCMLPEGGPVIPGV